MNRAGIHLLAVAFVCLAATTLLAQSKSPKERLINARAQYYTPTAKGLKSFHCEANLDWKSLLTRFSGSEISDDNPVLLYLDSLHMTVSDDLKAGGQLQYSSAIKPPSAAEQAIQQIEHGLQTSVSGFLQSWNGYMNGTIVPVPDASTTIVSQGDGFHLSATGKNMKLDEDFDKNMLLKQAEVQSPAMKVIATPKYVNTPDGLLISEFHSLIHQPPTAPQMEVTERIQYSAVDSFQIPSHVIIDVKNVGIIKFGLSNCQVSLADWANKH